MRKHRSSPTPTTTQSTSKAKQQRQQTVNIITKKQGTGRDVIIKAKIIRVQRFDLLFALQLLVAPKEETTEEEKSNSTFASHVCRFLSFWSFLIILIKLIIISLSSSYMILFVFHKTKVLLLLLLLLPSSSQSTFINIKLSWI